MKEESKPTFIYSFYYKLVATRHRAGDELGALMRQRPIDEIRQQAVDEFGMPQLFGQITWFKE